MQDPSFLFCLLMCLCFNAGPQQGCGGYLTGSTHTFGSPDSDSNGRYDKNLNCILFITAPVNKLIKLTFSTFALEAATSLQRCIYDYVKVRLRRFWTVFSSRLSHGVLQFMPRRKPWKLWELLLFKMACSSVTCVMYNPADAFPSYQRYL